MNTAAFSSPDTGQKQIGRVLGPVMALGAFFLTANSLSDAARLAAASGLLMAAFWITEAIPLSATALLPLVLFPTLGVADIQDAAAPFAKPAIFLLLAWMLLT